VRLVLPVLPVQTEPLVPQARRVTPGMPDRPERMALPAPRGTRATWGLPVPLALTGLPVPKAPLVPRASPVWMARVVEPLSTR
jgi:hypothetical protein